MSVLAIIVLLVDGIQNELRCVLNVSLVLQFHITVTEGRRRDKRVDDIRYYLLLVFIPSCLPYEAAGFPTSQPFKNPSRQASSYALVAEPQFC